MLFFPHFHSGGIFHPTGASIETQAIHTLSPAAEQAGP
jgi:hypothetical protein